MVELNEWTDWLIAKQNGNHILAHEITEAMNGQSSNVCESPGTHFRFLTCCKELVSWTWNNVTSTGVVDAWALRFENVDSLSRFTHALSRAVYEVQNALDWEKMKVYHLYLGSPHAILI
jgi:hypothetical protein